jgi:hypothetical protein
MHTDRLLMPTDSTADPGGTPRSVTPDARPPGSVDGRPVLRFLGAAAIAGGLLWAVYAGFVQTELGQRLENLALAGAELRGASDREESLGNLSQISAVSFGVAILLVLAIALARRQGRLGLLAVAVMVASTIAAEVLKDVLSRPELVTGPAWLLRNTFPSGSATVATAIGIGALLVAPGRLRWLVMPMAAAYAAAIGQSTQIAGWHRLSGAIGGVFVVLVVACVALAVLADRGDVRRAANHQAHPWMTMSVLAVAMLILLVAVVITALPAAFPLLGTPAGAPSAFAHTAFDLIGVAVTVAAVAGFAVLIEPFSLGPEDPATAQHSVRATERP